MSGSAWGVRVVSLEVKGETDRQKDKQTAAKIGNKGEGMQER